MPSVRNSSLPMHSAEFSGKGKASTLVLEPAFRDPGDIDGFATKRKSSKLRDRARSVF
jgi:hypothetical protein